MSAPPEGSGPAPLPSFAGRAWAAGLFYAILFALLLLPLAREGALPGNCDTWLNALALPNAMLARAQAALTGADAGTSLYPERAIFGFGESSFGTAAIFIVFKLLAGEDALACYLLAVAILALDGVGVFLLARHYVAGPLAAAFAGLAFSASAFTLGNIDSPHTSFFFVAFLGLERLATWERTGGRGALAAAAALGGAQAWFSAYVFLFWLLSAGALVAAHLWRSRRSLRAELPAVAAAAALTACLSAPFFLWYAHARESANFVNPWSPVFLAEVHSLEPGDLLRPLEGNIIYPEVPPVVSAEIGATTHRMIEAGAVRLDELTGEDARTVMGTLSSPGDAKFFVTTRRCAFLGIALVALALVGAISSRRLDLVLLFAGSLLVAFGPFVTIGERLLPSPLWPAYRWLDLAGVLRVPSRAFSFAVLAVCLAAAVGLERLRAAPALRGGRIAALLPFLAAAIVLAENVPFPLKRFEGASLARPEALVTEFFEGASGLVLLDLPSRPGGALFGDSGDLFEWNRELIYMNRQTYHRQNILNGVHGYFPRSRLRAQRLIDALPAAGALDGLRAMEVDHIVYHHALELPWEGSRLGDSLAAAPQLEVVATSPEVTIFGWAPAP